jgi:hypothetical protein
MSILGVYRKVPNSYAIPIAYLASASLAIGLAVLAACTAGFLLRRFDPPSDGPGAGILVFLITLNAAIVVFVGAVSALVNLHHRTSWQTPMAAFALCVILVRALGPFDNQFAPFMLGTGAAVCLLCCWFLRRKENTSKAHVV